MKYVIVIPDGAADHPLPQLGGKTPFEAAHKPRADRLAMMGRQGLADTTPPGFPCGSDVCSMCLLGYDPRKYHKGRAPLEAAALGIPLTASDWIFRVNFVTVADGIMMDHSAGHISNEEGRALLEAIVEGCPSLGGPGSGVRLHPGVSYRNIMVDASGRDWSTLRTTPPHDIPGEPMEKYLPTGSPSAGWLRDFIEESQAVLAEHEINQARRETGHNAATHVWPWGQGKKPVVPSFESRFNIKGAMITAVDLLAGIASFIGWDRLDVPGQTSYHDTDYAAAGRHAIAALDKYDLVCVHIEAPDEAGHASDAATKVASLEAMDKHIVGPIHDALEKRGEPWRMLYMPDHYTAVATRKHDPTPVPFFIAGTRVHSLRPMPLSEKNATAADFHVTQGHDLMEFFLRGGL